MKRYVFFTCSVFGIGGGQLYVSNKTEYLRKKGYEVCTISSSIFSPRGKIFYQGLNQAENYVLTELRFYPDTYAKGKTKRIIKKVADLLYAEDCDEIILESNYLTGSVWAERIAARMNAKHVIFSISEHNEIDKYMCDFLGFKFKRNELATITKKSFVQLLDKSTLITEQNLPILTAYMGDPITENVDERIACIEESEYSICIMGRGEKRYVEYACLSVADFCKKHPDVCFTVGLVSVFSDKEKDQKIRELFASVKNVKIHYLGYFSPIPKALFEVFHLFIGGAGCAWLPYRQKALTLAMDLYHDKPLGLLGYDIVSTAKPSAKGLDMAGYLEDVFFQKKYLAEEYIPLVTTTTADTVFSAHDRAWESSSNEKQYYTAVNKNIPLKEKVKTAFPFLVTLWGKLIKLKTRIT